MADAVRLCFHVRMRHFWTVLWVGLVAASCSDPRAGSDDPDPGKAIARCLNEELGGRKSEHTRITYVAHERGQTRSYVVHVFSGDFYPAEIDPPVPITNMVVAAHLSNDYFEALREDPPKSREDYDDLRARFEELDDLRMSDMTRHGALTFLEADLAAIEASAASILPRQSYLVRDGKWAYKIISDGPPDEDLRSKTREILKGIDRYATSCEPRKEAETNPRAISIDTRV